MVGGSGYDLPGVQHTDPLLSLVRCAALVRWAGASGRIDPRPARDPVIVMTLPSPHRAL